MDITAPRAAFNAFLQARRSQTHATRLAAAFAADNEAEAEAPSGDEWPDLPKMLAVLSDDERLTMVLCYAQGFSHSEISDVIDMPLGTVKSHLQRAKTKIRERFAPGSAPCRARAPEMTMASDDDPLSDDGDFARLFVSAAVDLPDGGFTPAVMARVRANNRRRLIRVIVLSAAGSAGLAFALGPIVEVLGAALRWDASAWIEMYRLQSAVVLVCLLAWPALTRLVAR